MLCPASFLKISLNILKPDFSLRERLKKALVRIKFLTVRVLPKDGDYNRVPSNPPSPHPAHGAPAQNLREGVSSALGALELARASHVRWALLL